MGSTNKWQSHIITECIFIKEFFLKIHLNTSNKSIVFMNFSYILLEASWEPDYFVIGTLTL